MWCGTPRCAKLWNWREPQRQRKVDGAIRAAVPEPVLKGGRIKVALVLASLADDLDGCAVARAPTRAAMRVDGAWCAVKLLLSLQRKGFAAQMDQARGRRGPVRYGTDSDTRRFDSATIEECRLQ